jgi:formyltetrahydrofolate deformylase
MVRCSDRPGIVAAVSGFLHAQGANIHQSDQYSTDPEGGSEDRVLVSGDTTVVF